MFELEIADSSFSPRSGALNLTNYRIEKNHEHDARDAARHLVLFVEIRDRGFEQQGNEKRDDKRHQYAERVSR